MKRLLVIDSNVTFGSPSMRCWLAAADSFMPLFDEIEVWSQKCDLNGPNVKFVKIREIPVLAPLNYLFFLFEVNKRFRDLAPLYLQETLVQCTGCMTKYADIRFIHFWDISFMELAEQRNHTIRLDLKDHFLRRVAVSSERAALLPGATRTWWCVSRGIAQPIAMADRSGAVMRYLPNSYDDTRFNHAARKLWRSNMRSFYGLRDDETVFCFSSFGHFERKGLRQAAEVVNLLNGMGFPVRLLVLGGRQRTISRFKKSLNSSCFTLDYLIFTGMVSDMEKHLSAADALLFPSHFEAFSLVEIEAAALGLRLYLTSHPGHEMILRETVNGRLLPWEVSGMANVLADEIRSGAIREAHDEIGEALPPDRYKMLLGELFEESISRKWRHS